MLVFCKEQQFVFLYPSYVLIGKIILQGVESYVEIKSRSTL